MSKSLRGDSVSYSDMNEDITGPLRIPKTNNAQGKPAPKRMRQVAKPAVDDPIAQPSLDGMRSFEGDVFKESFPARVSDDEVYARDPFADPYADPFADSFANAEPVNSMDGSQLQMASEGGQSEDEQTESKGRSFLRAVLDFINVMVLAFIVAFAIRYYVIELYIVPTGSMLQTIQEQDMLVGEKISLHFAEPEVGDIVTFKDPVDPNKILIKRIIAKGGSTVDLKDGYIYVDGKKLTEPYTSGQKSEPESHSENLGLPISYPFEIPEGYVWVMGDNRGNSLDSRSFGPVQVSGITSKALWIVWPFEDVTML